MMLQASFVDSFLAQLLSVGHFVMTFWGIECKNVGLAKENWSFKVCGGREDSFLELRVIEVQAETLR
jgi:hypothetical protein